MGDLQQELEELKELSLKDQTNVEMLRSRIDEQSILICKLKQRADLTLLRCQALDRINTELRNQQVNMETELQTERQKSEQLEKRFMDLATNHEEMIKFKDEYKQKNAELMKENKRLQEENDTFFSKELQEKEETIHKLSQGLRDIHEKHTNSEREHQEKEAILQDKLHNTQKKLKKAVDMNEEMALQLRQIQERGAMTETEAEEKFEALMKEKHKLLELSMQRGKIIQDKQEEIQELEKKKNKAEEARQEAEDRFKREADAVNTELRVKQLQNALEKAKQKCIELKREFDAHKNYSTHLLEQERALNARLRHMIN